MVSLFSIFLIFINSFSIIEDEYGNQFFCQEQYDIYYERLEVFTAENCSIIPGGIVFIGNSIIQGFPLKKYFPEANIYNRGIVADKIGIGNDAGVLKRMNISCYDLQPSVIFIMIGINDIADGRRSAKTIAQGVEQIVNNIFQRHPMSEVYIHSILPIQGDLSRLNPSIDSVNTYLQEMVDMISILYFVRFIDLHMLFSDDYGQLFEELTWDGIHLNSKGYDIWAEFISTLIYPDRFFGFPEVDSI